MEHAIKIKDLVKKYDDFLAVNQFSLQVNKGEILGFLGPNGAGKTTILECIVGLREITNGEVYINDLLIDDNKKEIKHIVGIQPQETNLFQNLTVKETLQLFSGFYENSYDVNQLIHLVGLEKKAKERVHALSGGQRQRLIVAISIVSNPEILFLDEPTSSLDPQARINLWDLILQFKEQGRTVILTTHSMEEAQAICNRVVIIDRGRTIALGTPEQLIENHFPEKVLHFYTTEKLSEDTLLNVNEIISVNQEIVEDMVRVSIRTENLDVTIKRLTEGSLIQSDWSSISVEKGNLGDVFLKLTGKSIREE